MRKTISSARPTVAVDYDATLIMAVETSSRSSVAAARVPGFGHIKAKRRIDPMYELKSLIQRIGGLRLPDTLNK